MELLFVDVSLLDSEVLLYSGPCNDSQHCGRRIVDWNVRHLLPVAVIRPANASMS